MGLYKFSIGAKETLSTLKEKLDGIKKEGANISYTIIAISEITLQINDIQLNVRYELSSASTAQYFWYLCDAYKKESLIIL